MTIDGYSAAAVCNRKTPVFGYSTRFGYSVRNRASYCFHCRYSGYSIYYNIIYKYRNRAFRNIWEIGVTTVTTVTASPRHLTRPASGTG